ncbi:MAG: hypothetical protein KDC45_12795 [Bacteroidetes bacterium]|nr:hypothetical protein [Bacteroidota bacterium]
MTRTFWLAIALLIPGCKDLAHDNPLDPNNPDGKADQIVVVENYIIKNTKSGTVAPPYNQYSQDALYGLTDIYDERMLILEYHMIPVDTAYQDSLATADNEFRYVNEYQGGANRGFPHTFFNGKQKAIQGASNSDLVRTRYQAVLDSATAQKVGFFCYAEQSISGSMLTIDVQLVRYGTETNLEDVRIEYIVFENKGGSSQFTVRKILAPASASLPAGKIFEPPAKSVDIAGFDVSKTGVVVMIKDPTSKRVLQANLAVRRN